MNCTCRIGTLKASRNPCLDDVDELTIVKCGQCLRAEETAAERDRLEGLASAQDAALCAAEEANASIRATCERMRAALQIYKSSYERQRCVFCDGPLRVDLALGCTSRSCRYLASERIVGTRQAPRETRRPRPLLPRGSPFGAEQAGAGGGEMTWQPGLTVPMDGGEVLLIVRHLTGSRRRFRLVAHWMPNVRPSIGGVWYFWNNGMFDPLTNDVEIEHWQPLPDPPASEGRTP